VGFERLEHAAGQACVAGVVRVGGEGKHHLLGDAERLILAGVLDQRGQEIGPLHRASVEIRAVHAEDLRHVAVGAAVSASSVRIGGQRRILPGLTGGSVDDRASFHAHAVGIDLWCGSRRASRCDIA